MAVTVKAKRRVVAEPVLRYWWHPESSSGMIQAEHPGDTCEEVTKEQYEKLVAEQEKAANQRKQMTRAKRASKPKTVEPFWDLYKHGVTQSILAAFLTCPEKARLGTMEGLSPLRTGGALSFGSMFHEVLDRVYSAERDHLAYDTQAIIDATEADDRKKLETSDTASPYDAEQIEENYALGEPLLHAYFGQWKGDFSQYRWESLEQVFGDENGVTWLDTQRADARPIPVRGKFDGVFRMNDWLWLFETKTKARIEEAYISDSLAFNLQVNLYLWAMAKVYGERPAGVVYNLVRRPQLRRGKTETLSGFSQRVQVDIATRPEFYFQRLNCTINEQDGKAWELEFDAIMRMFVRWVEEGQPANFRNSSACSMYGGCQYLPICGQQDYSRFTRRLVVFPELTPGAEAGE